MSKYLYIESYAVDGCGILMKEHRESDVFPVERIMHFGIYYDKDSYVLSVRVDDTTYRYRNFSDKFTDRHKDEIVNKYVDFLEDAEQRSVYLNLTQYQE